MFRQNHRLSLHQEVLLLCVFVAVLFIMGVVFGALMVNALTPEQNQDLSLFMQSFFHSLDQGTDVSSRQTYLQIFVFHLKWIAVIWFLGLSVIGLPLIFILDFLKGVLVGFTVGYLTGQFSWKGLLIVFVSVAPQNLILIPALLLFSVSAVSFSVFILKNRILSRNGGIAVSFKQYVGTAVLIVLVMAAASLYEAFAAPALMKWVNPVGFAG